MKKTLKIAKALLASIAMNTMAMPPKLTQNAAQPISRLNKDLLDTLVSFLDPESYLKLIKTSIAIKENTHLSFDAFSQTQSQANFLIITNKANILDEYSTTGIIPAGLQSFLSHISDDNEEISMAIITDENHPLLSKTTQNLILIPINQSVIPHTIARNLLITGNITKIQNSFLSKTFTSTSTLTHVAFQTDTIISIEAGFLSHCTNLTSFNASGMTSLTSIEDYFLSHCISLNNLTLPTSVTSIGSNFLYSCTNLKTFDTRGLTSLTSIGNYFLYNCTSLNFFDSHGLNALTSIGVFFLSNCTNLTSFDSRGLTSLTSIGQHFLFKCINLKTFYTSGLSAVTSIRSHFLCRCTSLTSFDTSGLNALTSIGDYFLSDCKSLTYFDSRGLTSLTSIGDCFLSSCTSLTSFDTSSLTSITSIGNYFLPNTINTGLIIKIKTK
jgi:hypothetical protein